MLRLASSTVVPNALRAIVSPKILSGSITNAFSGSHQESLVKREIPFISHQYFSSDAKKLIADKLVKILKSEIKSKQLVLGESIPRAPTHFPFTIAYSPCKKRATLTRELNGERIEVVVALPRNIPEDDGEESDSSCADVSDDDSNHNGDESSSTDSDSDEEKEKFCAGPIPHVHLYVKIFKENGKILDLRVSAAAAHEIAVSVMSVMEPAPESDDRLLRFGPYSVGLDSDLQFALREYLEIRGIKKSIGGFLYKYMVWKSKRGPMNLLKRVKKFIKE